MQSLERAYDYVKSGLSLITESEDLAAISDREVANSGVLPEMYQKFYVSGSGKANWNGSEGTSWNVEYLLKFPFNEWSDGTEDEDTTHEYVEQQITKELPQTNSNTGQPFVQSYAVVVGEQSDENVITVRCILRGGSDV